MQDPSQDYWLKRRQCQERLQDLLAGHGYQFLDTPILEPTELFLRKSGGALAAQMYSFTDPGGQPVSLRPEFTAPIMRHYLAHAATLSLPARFQYAGPVFRYDESSPPISSGQFTQVGAELIGAAGVEADAELLSLAAQLPGQLGIGDVRLELADISVLHQLLDAVGVSPRARSFILAQVPALRPGVSGLRSGGVAVREALNRAVELDLVGQGPEDDGLAAAIAGLDDDQARRVLRGLFHWQNVGAGLGQRNPDEVVERLLRKLRGGDSPGQLARGLELVAQLAALKGQPRQVVEQARTVLAQAGAGVDALDRLSELVARLQDAPELAGGLTVDFGLVRELAYYNGVVFQATHRAGPAGARGALGGGGRYDGLARALGGPGQTGVPALGFAYTLEALLDLMG